MVENKCRISITPDIYEALEERGKSEYGLSVSHYARMLLHRALQTECQREDGKRVYELVLDNADEIESYVEAKRLGSVPTFAGFALEQAMSRAPLTEAQKQKFRKAKTPPETPEKAKAGVIADSETEAV